MSEKQADEIEEYPVKNIMRCKIGTHATTTVYVDARQKKVRLNQKLRIRVMRAYSMWQEITVDKIYRNGFFFASWR